MEALPAATVLSLNKYQVKEQFKGEHTGKQQKPKTAADESIGRSGETLRHNEWMEELEKSGVRAHNKTRLELHNVQTAEGCRYIHAMAEEGERDKKQETRSVLISFGPEYAPMDQRQVGKAWQEARKQRDVPDILLFVAFQFDAAASKVISESAPKTMGMQLLQVEMNSDLLVKDLKKKQTSSDSFWLVGQPDVRVYPADNEKDRMMVEVIGFDYYNPKTKQVEDGGTDRIATWLLDTDYDERSLFPRQVFFPGATGVKALKQLSKKLKCTN